MQQGYLDLSDRIPRHVGPDPIDCFGKEAGQGGCRANAVIENDVAVSFSMRAHKSTYLGGQLADIPGRAMDASSAYAGRFGDAVKDADNLFRIKEEIVALVAKSLSWKTASGHADSVHS